MSSGQLSFIFFKAVTVRSRVFFVTSGEIVRSKLMLAHISKAVECLEEENYTGHGLVWLTLGFSLALPLVLGLDA